MRGDLLGGLRNALSHGAKIEDAIATFVNAGYNEYEVKEAAQSITRGSLDILTATPPEIPSTLSLPQATDSPVIRSENKRLTRKILILACTLLILVCALLLAIFLI